jgi:hypothetical protein
MDAYGYLGAYDGSVGRLHVPIVCWLRVLILMVVKGVKYVFKGVLIGIPVES